MPQPSDGHTPEEAPGRGTRGAPGGDDPDAAMRRSIQIVQQADRSNEWFDTVSTTQFERVSGAAASGDPAESRRLGELLREREEHLRLIVESATDFAIFTLGLDGRIVSWNIGAERILGYTEEEILGQHVSIIFTPEDIARGQVQMAMSSASSEGRKSDDRWHVRKGGVRFWANGMMMPLTDEASQTRGYLKILRDRTEQKLASELLRTSEKALRDADRQKDEFLSLLAHELRNPLAAINNAVQLWLRTDRAVDVAWIKDVIERQAKHLARLIDDLLEVSHITRGMIELHKERIDLAPVIKRAVEIVRPLLERKRLDLEVAVGDARIDVIADPMRVEQVIVNLLTNAGKYTHEGGKISLTSSAGPEVTVTVKDDGVGIPPEMLPHIFDVLVQVNPALDRAQGGLGIGLTVVKNLVERHGGTVSAASEGVGKGSEFTVRLPAAAKNLERQDKSTAPPKQSGAPWPADAPLRVLLVDDNRDSAAGMSKLLRLSGYHVLTAGNGPTAMELARTERPDVILLDIGLPGMDGYQVAEQIRKEGSRDTLLVAVSGYGQDQDRRRSRDAGFNLHLVKPVDLQQLLSLLENWRPTRQSRRDP